MQRMTLYVSYHQAMLSDYLEEEFGNYLISLFGGYTVTNMEGAWREGGTTERDCGFRFEVLAPAIQPEYCKWAAEKARAVFDQKCVLVTLEEVKGWFVTDNLQTWRRHNLV